MNTKIIIAGIIASIVLFFATPFFPFDELAMLAISLIAGIVELTKK